MFGKVDYRDRNKHKNFKRYLKKIYYLNIRKNVVHYLQKLCYIESRTPLFNFTYTY